MPELPDLQVYSQNLSRKFRDHVVSKVRIFNEKKLNAPKSDYSAIFEGSKLNDVQREGKELHFHFSKGTLGLHLMLKGQLQYFESGKEIKSKIIEIIFEDNTGLIMSDFMGQATPTLNPETSTVPDALSENLNVNYLFPILTKEKKSIKTLLLDQKIIRGIGNAYADEILYDCKISPFSIASNIPKDKVEDLVKSIKAVLLSSIQSIISTNPDIISGEIRDFFKVHTSKTDTTFSGEKINFQEANSKKTYYTESQIIY